MVFLWSTDERYAWSNKSMVVGVNGCVVWRREKMEWYDAEIRCCVMVKVSCVLLSATFSSWLTSRESPGVALRRS